MNGTNDKAARSSDAGTLLLIPSFVKEVKDEVAADRHPRMDYHALRDALEQRGQRTLLLDYGAAQNTPGLIGKLAIQGGMRRDVALVLLGRKQRDFDRVFTNGENLAIPWTFLESLPGSRAYYARHVTIGHHVSPGKKRVFFKRLKLHRHLEKILVYANTQYVYARDILGIEDVRLALVAFHADTQFWRPQPDIEVYPGQIASAGLEWRDYPTLIEAVRPLTEVTLRLAASSPWSKHTNETADRTLPPHVSARRYSYEELRNLYASSAFVAVPLYENDFQAGVTTLLEAMAMGKAVVVTRTTGQTDVIVEGENGLTVAPGDVDGWRSAIARLQENPALRDRLGRNARVWVEENASLERWIENVCAALKVNTASSKEAKAR